MLINEYYYINKNNSQIIINFWLIIIRVEWMINWIFAMKIKYDKDYYENGVAKGISGYENYRWIPELTYPMAFSICKSLKIKKNDKILEYGCAHGFLVKALNDFKIDTYGVDVSRYALSKVDPEIKKKPI